MKRGPNGRTIRKLLMRNRHVVIWGQRAYLTIKIPHAFFDEPPLLFEPPPGEEDVLKHVWKRQENGLTVHVSISKIGGGTDPRTVEKERIPHFPQQTEYYGWEWWEGVEYALDKDGNVLWRRDCPVEWVENVKREEDWIQHHIYLSDSLSDVVNAAKSTDCSFTKTHVVLTFGMKWFYPDEKLRFCSALRRLCKCSDVKIKVCK